MASLAAPGVIRSVGATLRVTIEGPEPEPGVPRIYAFLHGRQFALFRHPRPRPVAVMSSLSPDGRMQAEILTRLGFVVAAGSSTRGGAAGLMGIISLLRNGCDAAFTIDGPRGPYGEAKPGVILAAREAGAAIVPITSSSSRAWIFDKAWDRYLLPTPFSRVVILRAAAILVGETDAIDSQCSLLSKILLDLTAEADMMARKNG